MENLNVSMPHLASGTLPMGMAPMDGITEFTFRLWLRAVGGAGFFMTPFVRVTDGFTISGIGKLFIPEIFELKHLFEEETIPQVMGDKADNIVRVAEQFLKKAKHVDINCACPAKLVVQHGSGSALLKSPQILAEFLSPIGKSLGSDKFSVKIRSGFTDTRHFSEIISIINSVEAYRIIVHPRTQNQIYSGEADWSLIEKAALLSTSEVIGSGDIVDNLSYQRSLAIAPHAKGVIIGRGALKNPWIFRSIVDEKEKAEMQSLYYWAFGTYALLQFCMHQETTIYFSLIEKIFFKHFPCGYHVDKWKELYAELSTHLWNYLKTPINIPDHHGIMCKLKQLCKYGFENPTLRLSPTLLKSATIGEFFTALSMN